MHFILWTTYFDVSRRIFFICVNFNIIYFRSEYTYRITISVRGARRMNDVDLKECSKTFYISHLSSPHLTTPCQLTSFRCDCSQPRQTGCEATQFSLVATNCSALGPDEMRSVGEMMYRWVIYEHLLKRVGYGRFSTEMVSFVTFDYLISLYMTGLRLINSGLVLSSCGLVLVTVLFWCDDSWFVWLTRDISCCSTFHTCYHNRAPTVS